MEDHWKVLVAVVYILAAALLFTRFEGLLEAGLAFLLLAAVVVGFFLHPKKQIYYVRTTRPVRETSGHVALENDFVAVKVELVRLWVLFVPTVLAVSSLVFSSASGFFWNFSLLNWIVDSRYAAAIFYSAQVIHGLVVFVFLMLQAWIGERRVLRDAEASSTTSFTSRKWGVTYAFLDEAGSMYGGDCVNFHIVRPTELTTIVFYSRKNPDVNGIAMAFLFHRLVVVGRGVTDLNMGTIKAQEALAEMRPRPLAPEES